MKSLHILLFLSCCFLCPSAKAQTTRQRAEDAYEKLVALTNATDRKPEEIYSTLLECYITNHALLQSAAVNSKDYNQAHEILLRTWQDYGNAAAYFDNNKKPDYALSMAEAYVGMPLEPAFRGNDFNYRNNRAQLTYYVAKRYFDEKRYEKAIKYLTLYLRIGDEGEVRKNAALCLAKAYLKEEQTEQAFKTLDETIERYSEDERILRAAIEESKALNEKNALQRYLTLALQKYPQDEELLNDQGKLYEEKMEYANAAAIYRKLLQQNGSTENIKHVALNIYNQGVVYTTQAARETNKKAKKALLKDALLQYNEAMPFLVGIIEKDPLSLVFRIVLGNVYAQLGQLPNLQEINRSLAADGFSSVQANELPPFMDLSGKSISTYEWLASSGDSIQGMLTIDGKAPAFSSYAKEMIEAEIKVWGEKDPYETKDDYVNRVAKLDEKVEELKREAETKYIKSYTSPLTTADFTLRPYSADDQTYLVDSRQWGKLVVHVPNTGDEAKTFKTDWKKLSLEDAQYQIVDDHLALAALTFVTPAGKRYQYKSDKKVSYTEMRVQNNFNLDLSFSKAQAEAKDMASIHEDDIIIVPDVDINIPKGIREDTTEVFALIISNEDYRQADKVPFAKHDGEIFVKYCEKTLGIPTDHINSIYDATFMDMTGGIDWLITALNNAEGNAKAIVYYSGHGVPDNDHTAYLLPMDVPAHRATSGISLASFYKQFAEIETQGVTIFLDACFSGVSRDGKNLAEGARGAAIKPKDESTKGRVVSISATADNQTAWPYKEQQHGLFTYFLLKKLQETGGDVTIGELADYVRNEVGVKSSLINQQHQTPTVTVADELGEDWKNWKLK